MRNRFVVAVAVIVVVVVVVVVAINRASDASSVRFPFNFCVRGAPATTAQTSPAATTQV